MSTDGWERFRERLERGDHRAPLFQQWRMIKNLVDTLTAAWRQLHEKVMAMDEATLQDLYNTLILVCESWSERAGLKGVTDPNEIVKKLQAYLATGDPDAPRLVTLFTIRNELAAIRKPKDPPQPFSPEEFALGEKTRALWNRLAPALKRSVPGLSSPAVVDELLAVVGDYRRLVEQAKQANPANRMLRHAEEMLAQTMVFVGKNYLLLARYDEAKRYYEDALRAYGALNDKSGERYCERQLEALNVLAKGDVDTAMRSSLECLLAEHPAENDGKNFGLRSLERVQPAIELLKQLLDVGDFFEADRLLTKEVLAELKNRGYPDPGLDDVQAAFGEWVEHVPAELTGNNFYAVLMKVVEAYCGVMQGQSMVWEDRATLKDAEAERLRKDATTLKDDSEAERLRKDAAKARRQLQRLSELINRIGHEAEAVQKRLDRGWAEMCAKTVDPKTDDPDAALAKKLQKINKQTDKASEEISRFARALAALTSKKDERIRGEALDDVLREAQRLESEAAGANQIVYAAWFAMLRAEIFVKLGRMDDALSVLTSARTAANRSSGSDQLVDDAAPERALDVEILSRIALVQSLLKDDPAASATCSEAIDEIEKDRYKVSSPYQQSAFLNTRANVYRIGIWSAFKTGEYETMLVRAELSKARATLRQLGNLPPDQPLEEMQRQFQEACRQIDAARGSTSPEELDGLLVKRRTLWDLLMIRRARARTGRDQPAFRLDAVQAALDKDEAVVYYYWLTPTVLLIIAIDRHEVIVLKSVMSDENRAALDAFANFVLSLKQQQAFTYLDTVRRFSSLLLPDTLKPVLGTKRRVIISPHRLLHAFPFHALQWDSDYVIRQFAVSYTPNLSGLLMTHTPTSSRRVLALGIKDFGVPKERLNPLKDAEREADGLDTIYRERGVPVDVLKGPEATKSCLQRWDAEGKLEHYRLLHFATHGADIAGDNPMESYLFLQDARLDGLEIADWRLNADLVILSACHSGQRAIAGRGLTELPGDEIFGLQAAFFLAGARRVVGALWPADSRCACEIMTGFHRHLARGEALEVALQGALNDHLNGASLLTKGLYYWAPFFLTAIGRPSRVDPGMPNSNGSPG